MHTVNVSGLKNNPSEALRSARDDVVVVMNRDQPDAMLIGLQSGKLLSEPGARARPWPRHSSATVACRW